MNLGRITVFNEDHITKYFANCVLYSQITIWFSVEFAAWMTVASPLLPVCLLRWSQRKEKDLVQDLSAHHGHLVIVVCCFSTLGIYVSLAMIRPCTRSVMNCIPNLQSEQYFWYMNTVLFVQWPWLLKWNVRATVTYQLLSAVDPHLWNNVKTMETNPVLPVVDSHIYEIM
jgi:hypothetical protein